MALSKLPTAPGHKSSSERPRHTSSRGGASVERFQTTWNNDEAVLFHNQAQGARRPGAGLAADDVVLSMAHTAVPDLRPGTNPHARRPYRAFFNLRSFELSAVSEYLELLDEVPADEATGAADHGALLPLGSGRGRNGD